MVKLEWGEKHLCGNCDVKFYDMRQAQAICPSCGEKVKPLSYTTGATKPKSDLKEVATRPTKDPVIEDTTDDDIAKADVEVVEEEDDISSVINAETVATQKGEN